MRWLVFVLSLLVVLPTQGQTDSLHHTQYRKWIVVGGSGAFTVGSLVGLNQAWYKDYNTGKFHFFNDNAEWLQMDKVGHLFSTYQSARLLMSAMNWAGYNKKQTYVYGAGLGFVYMTAIEIMDGFSKGWGYSWGDQLADGIGTAAALSQALVWKEQRIQLKFSFSRSGLAKYNPNLLGSSLGSEILKDYNGQTYWVSLNPSSFFTTCTWLPKWINVAIGYGAYGMLGGHYNRLLAQDPDGTVWKVERERRYYLSLDLDLTRLPVRSKVLKSVFSTIGILKIPAPCLQFSKSGIRGYGLFF
jgi:hypothetical protein